MRKTAVVASPVNMQKRASLDVRPGDTVRVWQNIVDLKQGKAANKKQITTKSARKQAFEGLVLAVKHGSEEGGTFTVRKVASGVGVEKVFPLYSPMIDSIEIIKRARVRRAKLYFIRRKASRDVKRAMRRTRAAREAEIVESDAITEEKASDNTAAQEQEVMEGVSPSALSAGGASEAAAETE